MHKSAVVAKGSDSRATVPLPVPAPLACPASRQLRDRLRAMVADGAPPFDPAELPPPTDRIALQVRFCAR